MRSQRGQDDSVFDWIDIWTTKHLLKVLENILSDPSHLFLITWIIAAIDFILVACCSIDLSESISLMSFVVSVHMDLFCRSRSVLSSFRVMIEEFDVALGSCEKSSITNYQLPTTITSRVWSDIDTTTSCIIRSTSFLSSGFWCFWTCRWKMTWLFAYEISVNVFSSCKWLTSIANSLRLSHCTILWVMTSFTTVLYLLVWFFLFIRFTHVAFHRSTLIAFTRPVSFRPVEHQKSYRAIWPVPPQFCKMSASQITKLGQLT